MSPALSKAASAGLSGSIEEINTPRSALDPKKTYDGVNLIPYLTGHNKGRPHQQLYWRVGNRTAMRLGDWKLLRSPRRGVSKDWQLYNLADDISEQHNLASRQPEKLRELITVWKKLDSQMVSPIWQPTR